MAASLDSTPSDPHLTELQSSDFFPKIELACSHNVSGNPSTPTKFRPQGWAPYQQEVGHPTIHTTPSVPQNLSTHATGKPPAPEASYR